MSKVGRNDPCHCGSGQKYKKCHLAADDAARSAEIAKANAEALAALEAEEAEEAEEEETTAGPARRPQTRQETGAAPPKTATKAPPAIRRKAI
jgi:uncharacterized protein YecA (UPF0149 family)